MADALKDAQTLYQESVEALRDQRRQITEDLLFSDPSNPNQWDDEIRRQREGDPGGKRPCLTMDQTGQYVANVAGQVEKQPPALHAIPVGGGADQKAAEQIDGRFRHIEYASRAQQHYARALTSAARAGVGYLVVRPVYVDRPLGWQEPRISSEPDPMRVVFDPWSVDTDGADADFGFILTPISVANFEAKWPKKEQADFGDIERKTSWDDRKSVLVAEQWIKEQTTRNVIVYVGADGQQTSGTEDEYWQACQAAMTKLQYIRNYNDKTTKVLWRRMSGAEVLEESEYPAESIGIVPVYGYVGFSDGRMKYCGIPRRARAPQQAYNYHISEQLAYIGTAPKAPWLASKRAVKGVETLWDRASVQARAWLPYNDLDELGAVEKPQRSDISVSLVNHEAGAAQALRDLQAAIGMYQANIGADSNVVSGVAYDAQKQQGEASTSHFPSHLAASLGQLGEIVMQMDAKLSDTQRKQPIIGIDGTPGSVNVDPAQQQAFQRGPDGVSINPNVGKYGVRVTVGASYVTQRKETNMAFTEIMRGNKELAPVVAPFWAQTLDFPGSDKFAQAMAAMAPAPVKAILQPEGADDAPDPAMLSQQLEQCKQALQEAIQHAHDAQKDADEAINKCGAMEDDKEIERYKAETDRLKVTGANEQQIQLIVQQLVNEMLKYPEQEPGEGAWQSGQPMDGPGPDGTPQHEQAEPPQMEAQEQPEPQEPAEPPEPPQPSPELMAVLQGQQGLQDAMLQLAQMVASPRRRIPVKDKAGNIMHVIDQIDQQEGGA